MLSNYNRFSKDQVFKIEDTAGYTPQIGQLVSMMNYTRYITLTTIKGLTTEQVDYLPSHDGNSIGALLLHMAAVEFGFQVELFDQRKPNNQEVDEWGAAYQLGDLGREKIKGQPLVYYVKKLEKVRQRTLEELKHKNDDWLFEEATWDGHLSNHYFIWFHTIEDEISHRGQVKLIKKML